MMSNIFLLVLLGALLQSSYSLSPSKNFLASRMTRKFLSSLQSSLDATASKNLILSPDSSISRLELSESILKLEKSKSVEDPASSPLLNGVWEVVNSAGVTSPGLVGYQLVKKFLKGPLDVQEVTVTISSVQPRITAATSVKVGSVPIDLIVTAELEVESGLRFKEKIKSAQIGSVDIPLTAANYSRTLIISYLDDDLLIVRDQYGAPDVLKRKPKEFLPSSAEGKPSSTDENGAPGS